MGPSHRRPHGDDPDRNGPKRIENDRIGHNMRMRKALTGVAVVLLASVVVLLAALGADFGISIYAEYRLARVVRDKARLGFDPFVAIIAFPLIPQAMRHRYEDVEIKATAADRPVI